MNERLAREKRLVQEERVLLKPAEVENPKMRIDARPFMRRGFAAIIKSGPREHPRDEWPLAHRPPGFPRGRAPGGFLGVVGREDLFRGVRFIHAARRESGVR